MEISLFCETIAMSMGLSGQDMTEFSSAFEKDKSGQHRILKAKFAVRLNRVEEISHL